jgi:hydrogenase nickel incorporation protein HypA/HybF
MHEVGLMQHALDIVFDRAMHEPSHHITAVHMRVGEDAGVVPDALQLAFASLSQNTIANDATLDIECVPVRCFCQACNRKFTPGDFFYECPTCGQHAAQVLSGHEFELVSFEVD